MSKNPVLIFWSLLLMTTNLVASHPLQNSQEAPNYWNEKLENLETSVVSNDTHSKHAFNVTLEPIYHAERNKIIFNVTWIKPPNIEVSIYKFKLSTNCSIETIEKTTDFDYNLTNILVPAPLTGPEIFPGCPYDVIMTAETYEGDILEEIVHVNVPECVEIKCQCRLLAPRFGPLNILQTSPGILKISWQLNDREQRKKDANAITGKMFEYRVLTTEHRHANSFKKLPLHSRVIETEKDYVVLNVTDLLAPDQTYEVSALFNNTYNCKAHVYANITMRKNIRIETAPKNSSITAWIVSLVLLFLLMILVAYFTYKNRLKIKKIFLNIISRGQSEYDRRNSYLVVSNMIPKRMQEVNMIYVDKEIVEGSVDRYEFPRSRLSFVKKIGSGAFGEVFLAKAFGIKNNSSFTYVAVKKLNERAPPEEMDDFLSEIEILKKIGEHPNIVRIFGCCKLKEPYLMVMEFVPCGDLLHYLLDLRNRWGRKRTCNSNHSAGQSAFSDSSDGAYITPNKGLFVRGLQDRPSVTETEYTMLSSDGFLTPTSDPYEREEEDNLSHTELQQFALQIANGMKHLEKIPIAHRDLAARNILIDEFKVLKISDFGLSRVGPYVNSRTQKLPLRWVSLEAIEDHFYDSKGDVWSFGVVLWEIGTLGAFPYENIDNVCLPSYLVAGNRLSRPEICTDELYSLMLRCWNRDPTLRPSFKELVDFLDVKKTRVYVDFSQLNPLYVFPPSKDDKGGGTGDFKERAVVPAQIVNSK